MPCELAGQDQKYCQRSVGTFISSIKFLGMPVRGHSYHNGVLWQLMPKRTHSLQKAREWLPCRHNWMSDVIQNKILEMFADARQQQIIISETQHRSSLGLNSKWNNRH